jgi:hypothetical protein
MAVKELLVNPFPELDDLMGELEKPEKKERFKVENKEQAEKPASGLH